MNDAWINAVEQCTGKESKLKMLSDGDGDLVRALGLVDDMGFGLGTRSKRFALLCEDGVVAHVAVDEGMDDLIQTSAESQLKVVAPAPEPAALSVDFDDEQTKTLAAVGLLVAAGAAAYFYSSSGAL